MNIEEWQALRNSFKERDRDADTGEPLLFKGGDFPRTDVVPAA